MLYHSFPLECSNIIRDYSKEYMNQFDGEDLYVKLIPIPLDIRAVLENELATYGLPTVLDFLCFKRKNKKSKRVHIDHMVRPYNSPVHTSLVIPVEGCADTGMYWMTGQYRVVAKQTDSGGTYMFVEWDNEPKFLDEVEINLEPMLCRVDIPHNAYSNDRGEYRTIVSIRFTGNPSIEELVKLRYNK